MQNPVYHAPTRAAINLSLPWHNSAAEIAGHNFNIIVGKLSKRMKSLNPAKLWGPQVFFSGVRYHTRNFEDYVRKPESLVIPSRPPPAE